MYVNPAFERLTGSSRSDVLGLPDAARIFAGSVSEGKRPLLDEIELRIATGCDWSGEAPTSRPDGSTYQAWGFVSAIRDADGSVTSHIAVIRDVTREREA